MKMLLSFLLMVAAGIAALIWLRHRHIKEPLRRLDVPKVTSAETPIREPQNVSPEPLANQKTNEFRPELGSPNSSDLSRNPLHSQQTPLPIEMPVIEPAKTDRELTASPFPQSETKTQSMPGQDVRPFPEGDSTELFDIQPQEKIQTSPPYVTETIIIKESSGFVGPSNTEGDNPPIDDGSEPRGLDDSDVQVSMSIPVVEVPEPVIAGETAPPVQNPSEHSDGSFFPNPTIEPLLDGARIHTVAAPAEEPTSIGVPPTSPIHSASAVQAPAYQPTAPPSSVVRPSVRRAINPRSRQTTIVDLRLRLQLVFGRGGMVKSLALIPDRRDTMPAEIAVIGGQGRLNLVELRDDCYEAVSLSDAANFLAQGIEWSDTARRWRWILSGRELYVLAPGDELGLCGFVSTARLRLNARHVVLATSRLRGEVLSALTEAGCNAPEISVEVSGAPPGWLLFRNVVPTRPVQRNERDILNALRPAHEIEPHFIGGIRLERNSWLADFPPRIQFTGEFANGFQVMIDGQSASQTTDGAFEAPGWNWEGEHRLWFGDRAETYSIKTMEEDWQNWHAHNFGTGVAICGASTRHLDSVSRQQVRVPTSNPVLVGSYPGEIFRCDLRNDVRCETVLKMIPFTPVWALPLDSAHADKKSARILLFRPAEPANDIQSPIRNLAASRAWISVIREAGSKGLSIAPDDAQSKALWQRYRIVAKQLRRRMR